MKPSEIGTFQFSVVDDKGRTQIHTYFGPNREWCVKRLKERYGADAEIKDRERKERA